MSETKKKLVEAQMAKPKVTVEASAKKSDQPMQPQVKEVIVEKTVKEYVQVERVVPPSDYLQL